VQIQSQQFLKGSCDPDPALLGINQGWVFAMAKSIFARTVEKTVEKTGKKIATYKIVQKHSNWSN